MSDSPRALLETILHAALGMTMLLSAGGLLAAGLYLLGIMRDTLRPPRRTMAWALARSLPTHPEDLGQTAREQRYPRADGRMTPCWVISGQAPSSGLITIILHGHGRSRWDSLRRMPPWLERSAFVVLPDLRGHGDAEGPTTLGRKEPRDIVLLMNELAAEHPGARFHLVGHSMGAVVAIHAAALVAQSGPPVEEVVAWGPYETTLIPLRARLRARGLPCGPFPGLVQGWIRLLDGAETLTTVSVARLNAPLRVYAADNDFVSPPQDAQAIARAARQGMFILLHDVPHAELGACAGMMEPGATPPSQAAATSAPPPPCHPTSSSTP